MITRPVTIDFETFYSKKLKYSLTTSIAETYCQHDLFDPYMVAVYDGTNSWVGRPKDLNWAAIDRRDLLAHNAYFEATILQELQRRQWVPKLNHSSITCTANMTSYLCGRRSLDQAVEKLFGTKIDKSARADAVERHWPDGFSAAERVTMQRYALGDVTWTHKLFAEHGHRWPEVERQLSRITIDQGMKGVQINVELLDEYICHSHEMKRKTEDVIPWIKDAEDEEWEDFFSESDVKAKPTSTKCIAEQCRRERIPCPPVKSEDEEAYELWENTYKENRPWILALSAWRSANKLYRTFLVMKSRIRPDGTMPFALLYFGAHTGRWSGTARINFQNQRRKPVFANEHGLMEMNEKRTDAAMKCFKNTGSWPEWVKYTIDFRRLIIPRPNKKMIVSDLSQIEPRVLAWLTGDTALFEMLKKGIGIYEAHAVNTMGYERGAEKMKDANPMLYALAKVRVLGLGYGAGWEKFITMAATLSGGDVDLTKDDPEFVTVQDMVTGHAKQVSGYGTTSKRIVKEFRDGNKPITDLWKLLDDSLKRSVGEDFVMTLPSGRKMTYEKIKCERRIEPDPETNLPRSRSVYTAGIGNKRVMTYGGKLTENLVQATAREVFGEQLVRMDAKGIPSLFSVHDEGVFEVDQSVTAKDVEHEMSYCPPWLEGCPIGAEAKEVPHYIK
jgi:hypothetical protein